MKIVGILIFFKDGGFRYCNKCFYSASRIFIKELTFKDRCFRQKCIYKREYGLEMSSNEKYELLLKLQKIDPVLKKINEKWKRKRMINISYVIKRVLSEYDKTRADKIQLHLSERILKFYDDWYDNFQKTQ